MSRSAELSDSPGDAFPDVQWQLVLDARVPGREGELAVEALCRLNWHPVFFYLRRKGFASHDAEDLTQAFFQKLLKNGFLLSADQDRGSLRSLLMTMLGRFLIDDYRAARAVKRGGAVSTISMDDSTGDPSGANFPAETRDPEKLHEAAWARKLISRARTQLRESYRNTSAAERAAALDPYLDPDAGNAPYAALSARFGVTVNSLHLLMRRLRSKLASLLLEALAQSVRSPEELQDELLWFYRTLAAA
jgi:DNA-directed RNA polymerase specialized sigma24 family protein